MLHDASMWHCLWGARFLLSVTDCILGNLSSTVAKGLHAVNQSTSGHFRQQATAISLLMGWCCLLHGACVCVCVQTGASRFFFNLRPGGQGIVRLRIQFQPRQRGNVNEVQGVYIVM